MLTRWRSLTLQWLIIWAMATNKALILLYNATKGENIFTPAGT